MEEEIKYVDHVSLNGVLSAGHQGMFPTENTCATNESAPVDSQCIRNINGIGNALYYIHLVAPHNMELHDDSLYEQRK